ncbi:TPA: Rpn family recombination-promoting nuclease/putative transposase [Salmonella enterica subsp. enterica serovar Yarrabah]
MKKSTTSTPHDAVFKTFLRHPETARDFMEIHLPVSLRQRDLLGLVERIASLLVTGCANDRQLKALFNYLMIQHGHTPRFTTFIRDVVGHVPHTKERLMTLIERIRAADRRKGERQGRQVGLEEGLEKGLEKGQRVAALRIARQMLADGLDRETVQRFTGSPALRLKSFRMLVTNAVPV